MKIEERSQADICFSAADRLYDSISAGDKCIHNTYLPANEKCPTCEAAAILYAKAQEVLDV